MPEQRYTVTDLLAAAAVAGSPVSGRLITDWVARGLLDRPVVRGLGRGKGTDASWPEEQHKLFALLLQHRQKSGRRLATLCNIPVTLWLDSEGLDHDLIPVRQVRRALASWADTYRAVPKRAARHTAEELIKQYVSPRISTYAQRQLINATMHATAGGELDRDALAAAGLRAFRSERFVAQWVRTVEGRLAAIDRLDSFDDGVYEQARATVNQSAGAYAKQELDAAGTQQAREQRAWELINELANNACLALLSALGFLELARREPPTEKSPARPLTRPAGTAHGKEASECIPTVASPSRTGSQ